MIEEEWHSFRIHVLILLEAFAAYLELVAFWIVNIGIEPSRMTTSRLEYCSSLVKLKTV